MDFVTVVHIAGEPEEKRQLCSRCYAVLIDARNAMVVGGGSIAIWKPGAFVGEIKGNPTGYFLMDRDATKDDELACNTPRA